MLQKKKVFSGAGVALITPFKDGNVDYNALDVILEQQIAGGTDAIIACGTTAEAATLTDLEHRRIISHCVEKVAGRVPVIAGTGSNHTDYAIELTKFSKNEGADGVLLVTPYYNKASQKSLVKHFQMIAECADIPNILYNVPSRTGVNIEPATVAALAKHPNINAIKEASGNISKIAEIAHLCGDEINIYSGNDDQVIPIMSLGGKGCISVLSNVLPKESALMCKKFFDGDIKGAAQMQLKYLPLINALFSEVNPIPVKAAMAEMGYCEDYLRLPLTPMESTHREVLFNEMRNVGINI